MLRETYISCLNNLLKSLIRSEPNSCFAETKAVFCEILSKVDADEIKDEELLEKYHALFSGIVELLHTKPYVLKHEDIYSCLVGSSGNGLLELFQEVEVSFERNKSQRITISTGLSENEFHFLRVLQEDDRQCVWRKLFQFSCDQQRHFLDFFVVSIVRKLDLLILLEQYRHSEYLF